MYNPYKAVGARNDIELLFRDIPQSVNGYFARVSGTYIIVINANLNRVERRCSLTHELGHYFLKHSGNYFTDKYVGGLNFDKQEHDAWRWAADRLIDTHDLKTFMRQDHQFNTYDICDMFNVTEQVLFFKIQRLACQGALTNFLTSKDTQGEDF